MTKRVRSSKQVTPAEIKESRMTLKQAESLRERCKAVGAKHQSASIELCKVVWETEGAVVKVDGEYTYCWALWGFSSWEDYLGKELDLHLTTAYSLKNVWEVFYVELRGAWDESLLLGITKMKILASAGLTRKNVESWLRKAQTMTCRKLRADVYGTEELHTLQLPLTGSQLSLVRGALDMAKTTVSNGEKMNRGELLTHIIRSWRDANRPKLRSAAA
jgi:hypothetical protein